MGAQCGSMEDTKFVQKKGMVRTQQKRCCLIIPNLRTGFCQMSRGEEGCGDRSVSLRELWEERPGRMKGLAVFRA